MGPPAPVAQIRLRVRQSLRPLRPGELALAACSGGADSLALAAALAFEAPRLGLRGGGVTVDHGLQDGSAERAALVAETLRDLGLDPVCSIRATVAAAGDAGYHGPEAAARAARYAALDQAAAAAGAAAILLGHTRDDQAETVLLGLARGSGARSLAGMAPVSGRYLRPLLQVRRAQTEAACAALGLAPWQDPHNSDPGYARARVRHQVLPMLEQLLGPGIAGALARTADQLRADSAALDGLAAAERQRLAVPDSGGALPDTALPDTALPASALPATALPDTALPASALPDTALPASALPDTVLSASALPAAALADLPAAIRTRLLRDAAVAAGCPAGALTAGHMAALDALVTRWHGQRWIDLPGYVRCRRECDRLLFTAAPRSEGGPGPGGRQ